VTDTVTTISTGASGVTIVKTQVRKLAGRMSWREITAFQ